jgi:hypothetical protein
MVLIGLRANVQASGARSDDRKGAFEEASIRIDGLVDGP